jgi:hypothetical protein
VLDGSRDDAGAPSRLLLASIRPRSRLHFSTLEPRSRTGASRFFFSQGLRALLGLTSLPRFH